MPRTARPPILSHFISSICAPGLIEMPPVSNVMALPTSAMGVSRFRAAAIFENDEARRIDRALADGEDAAEAVALELTLVPDFDAELAALRQLPRLVGEDRGREACCRADCRGRARCC